MKSKSVILAGALSLALAATFSSASAQSSRSPIVLTQDAVIQGLGERFPNAPNVSKSENFRVYEFKKAGITYVQINTLDGDVLAAVGLTKKDAFVLPVGTLSVSQVVASQRAGMESAGPTVTGTCPCSAQVVYDGPNATIVVVYGAGGEVIQVVTILKGNQQQ